jgi:hypothetical protein
MFEEKPKKRGKKGVNIELSVSRPRVSKYRENRFISWYRSVVPFSTSIETIDTGKKLIEKAKNHRKKD